MAGELATALAKVQGELEPIAHNQHGQVGPREYDYADLKAVSAKVLPLLSKHGLAFVSRPTRAGDGQMVLAYSLLHASGEREDGEYPLGTGTHQQLGSAITYGRRYCLCALTGAVAEADLDGAEAPQVKQPRQQRRPSAPPAEQKREPEPDGQRGTTPAQVINIQWKRLGIEDRDERLALTGKLAGKPVASTNDLAAPDQIRVKRMLSGCRDIGQVHDLIRSINGQEVTS